LINIADIVPGEFPVDAWYPIPLGIPEGGSMKNIRGRFPGGFSVSPMSPMEQDGCRVVDLPIYQSMESYDLETLRGCDAWNGVPDTVPVLTLAVRYDGYYCEQRRAQAVSVFPIWANDTSMLLELDWCEGSLEDCITPEWHLRASPRVSLQDGVDKLRGICRNRPMWEECCFCLYVIPTLLGSDLLGQGKANSSKIWQREWKYSKHEEMLDALSRILTTIRRLRIGESD